MRIVYIDVCARTVNPTDSFIPALLRLSSDAVCYGPGYVSANEMSGGIAKFIDNHGPFDFYAMRSLSWRMWDHKIRYYHRYMFPNYPSDQLGAFGADVTAFLARSSVPRIVFLTGLDPYGISEENARLITETNGYLVAWAGGFSKPMHELDLDVFTNEEFFARKKKLGRVFGLWYDIITEYAHKFINLGHFMAESEFVWTALDGRSDKVVVPGQIYVRRKAARRKLAQQGNLARSGGYKFLMSIMDHAGLRPHARPLMVSLYNQTFAQSIATTRYAYTDGCGYEIPIRKFFEVPALGSILLSTPCAGFENFGFSDGRNAMVVAPDAIGDAVEWLRASPTRAQEIADAGRQLVWDRHSLHARAEQFTRCMNSIAAGRYRGSRWCNGEFLVDESPKTLRSVLSGSNQMVSDARPSQ